MKSSIEFAQKNLKKKRKKRKKRSDRRRIFVQEIIDWHRIIIETRETFVRRTSGTRLFQIYSKCGKFSRRVPKMYTCSTCTPSSFACKLFARASNGRRARQPKCNMCSSFCRPAPTTFESLHKVAKLPLKLCATYLDGICQM